MKEARVECLIAEYTLVDLSLTLRKGEVAFLSLDRAKRSHDLKHAKRIKAVSVRNVERWKMTKPVQPPWVRNLKRKPQVPVVKVPASAPAPAVALNQEEVLKTARQEAAHIVEGRIADLTMRLMDLTRALEQSNNRPASGTTSEDLRKAVEQGITAGLAKAQFPPGATRPVPFVADDDVPMFIPTGIVSSSDSKAAISLKTEQSSGSSSLDEASIALKAARPKRTKRTE